MKNHKNKASMRKIMFLDPRVDYA